MTHKVENDIRQNYAQKLTLSELANKYYINSAYLGQLFIRRHGITFNTRLWNERLSHAAFLLTYTDRYIYEIIESVGCKNVNYFNRQFINRYGLSPAGYRKESRKKQPDPK